jgi:hypothetical protein
MGVAREAEERQMTDSERTEARRFAKQLKRMEGWGLPYEVRARVRVRVCAHSPRIHPHNRWA